MHRILEIATNVSTPLMLAGFLAGAFFLIVRQILQKNVFPTLTRNLSSDIIKLIIERLFTLALVALVLGFAGFALTVLLSGAAQNRRDTPIGETALWQKNWTTLTEPRGFLGTSDGQWTNRRALLSALRALDFSTAPDLEAERRHLITLVEQAPSNQGGDQHYDMNYTSEIRDAEAELKRKVRGRAIDVGVQVQ